MISERGRAILAGVVLSLVGGTVGAQQPGGAPSTGGRTKAVQAIEIRGQVPTPQVVTVRPRQIPMFSREILTPAFFDERFWESLVAPYEIVPNLSAAAGTAPTAWTAPPLPADSSHRPPPADSARSTSSDNTAAPSSAPTPRSNGNEAVQSPTSNAPREK